MTKPMTPTEIAWARSRMNASEPRKATDADAREDDTPIAPRPHSEPLSTIEAYLQGQHGPPHPEVVRILEREATAPEPVGPSMARVEAAARAVNDALAGYDVHDAGVSATYKIAVAALAAADAVEASTTDSRIAPGDIPPLALLSFRSAWEKADREGKQGERVRHGLSAALPYLLDAVAPDGHAALVARLTTLADEWERVALTDENECGGEIGVPCVPCTLGTAGQRLRAALTATDRAASDESRVAAEWDALQVECDEAIEQAERHAEDVATAEREVSALRVTVAERDATIEAARIWHYGHVCLNCAKTCSALDGPDDRSGL